MAVTVPKSKKKRHNPAIYAHMANSHIDAQSYLIQAAFLVALHDVYGFGHDRLVRVYRHAQLYFQQVSSDMLSLQDLREALADELGIQIDNKGLRDVRTPDAEKNYYGEDYESTESDAVVRQEQKQKADNLVARRKQRADNRR